MNTDAILPFSRQGGWQSSQWLYFKAASNNLSILLIDKEALDNNETELLRDYPDDEHGYIDHVLAPDIDRLVILSTTIQILCCMSVEAFLNYYGVKVLGEDSYKRNYEKLGITQKLEILLAVSKRITLPKNSEIIKLTRKMFDKRNRLVHPKAKEVSFHDLSQGNFDVLTVDKDIIMEAVERVQEMRSFYTYFQDIDPEVQHEVRAMLADEDDAAALFS